MTATTSLSAHTEDQYYPKACPWINLLILPIILSGLKGGPQWPPSAGVHTIVPSLPASYQSGLAYVTNSIGQKAGASLPIRP